MKKEIILGSMFLTAMPLSSFADDTLNDAYRIVSDSQGGEKTSKYLTLTSAPQHINGSEGIFELALVEDESIDNQGYNKLTFEMSGLFRFLSLDSKDIIYFLGGEDGSIAFDVVHDDDTMTKYRGVSCSSTIKDCNEDFIIELRRIKSNHTWEMTLNLAGYEDGDVLNFSNEKVPLTQM